jgi:hypothetical protein
MSAVAFLACLSLSPLWEREGPSAQRWEGEGSKRRVAP